MKRILLALAVIAASSVALAAQPKSIGLRTGAMGFDASYQHTTLKNQFIEGNIGLDFGYNAKGQPGIKATAIYNFVWARPAWTQKGSWELYAGPGLSLGYVYDIVPYKVGKDIIGIDDNGFMLSFAAQVGIGYRFWFPLELSLDIRPYFGMHVNDGKIREKNSDVIIYHDCKVGFYDNGLLGFAPMLSVRYRF